ncbi:MAG TPA: hypothetical protein VHK47_07365, partial [Polyangia bacterium]|nr:hypothetical protein [Polyangia bacterium]
MPPGRSQFGVLALCVGALLALAGPARAADTFAWTPAGDWTVARGREVAERFDLLHLVEVTVAVDDAYSSANREALAAAERRLAAVPGVRRVYGPSRLLDLALDASGRATARRVLARGASESDGEEARQRVVRRADALGWFLSPNGREVRFFVDVDDFARVRAGVAQALASSGLGLVLPSAGDGLRARPL